jgi:hypothetical protein
MIAINDDTALLFGGVFDKVIKIHIKYYLGSIYSFILYLGYR